MPEDNFSSGITVAKLNGKVELTAVEFSYEPEQPVLKNITLEVFPGETIAVGPSGAEKTTFTAHLMRFYQPSGGDIKFDGISATEYNLKNLRSRLALVLQSPKMFSGTLLEGLRYSAPEAIKNMTVFIISYRFLTIRNADSILVLDSGSITGLGTHEELASSCRCYR